MITIKDGDSPNNKRLGIKSLLIAVAFAQGSYGNSILLGSSEHSRFVFGINSELYSLHMKRSLTYSTSYIAFKPYLEAENLSLVASPNLRLARDDAFMLTFGAEAGPCVYLGRMNGLGYNFRVNFTFLKVAQLGFGLRTHSLFEKPNGFGEVAIGLHNPLFGKRF